MKEHDVKINALAMQMLAGDSVATEKLLKDLKPILVSVLLKKNVQFDQIEDLIQESLFVILKQDNKFDPLKSSFISWMISQALWLQKTEYRKIEKRKKIAQKLNINPIRQELKSCNYDPEILKTLVRNLSAQEQDVIRFYHSTEVDFTAISNISGDNWRTIQSRYRRTNQRLKEQYLERIAV